MEYEVKVESVVEGDFLGERVRSPFSPGKHTPKNEAEETALERLVELGAATRVKPTKKES